MNLKSEILFIIKTNESISKVKEKYHKKKAQEKNHPPDSFLSFVLHPLFCETSISITKDIISTLPQRFCHIFSFLQSKHSAINFHFKLEC